MKSINIDVMDNGLRENLKVNGEEIPLNGLQLKPLLGVILEPVLKEAGVEKELGELLKSNSINIKITK